MVGVPYSAVLSATGGAPPYAFQVIEGSPEWLLLKSDGTLEGTPDATGVHDLLISVFDANFADASTSLSLEVTEPRALALKDSIPDAVSGRPYSAQVAVGGRPPYSWNVTRGSLPTGLAFDAEGRLAGNVEAPGSFAVSVELSDSGEPRSRVRGDVRVTVVEETALRIAVRGDIVVYTNADVSFPLAAEGGVPPYRWSLLQGGLQPGLRLDEEAGKLVGRVMRVQTATVTLEVADSEGSRDEAVVHVRAQVYRAQSSRGDERDSGCSCSTLSSGVDALPRPRDEPWEHQGLAFALFGMVIWAFRRIRVGRPGLRHSSGQQASGLVDRRCGRRVPLPKNEDRSDHWSGFAISGDHRSVDPRGTRRRAAQFQSRYP
jgi:hypothetical protein